MEAPKVERQSLLVHTFTDKAILRKAYMPFIKNGGLFFITTKKRRYKMGEKVSLAIKVNFDDVNENLRAKGKVVWITPENAEGYRSEGIGVQFSTEDAILGNKMEDYLAGTLDNETLTHTL